MDVLGFAGVGGDVFRMSLPFLVTITWCFYWGSLSWRTDEGYDFGVVSPVAELLETYEVSLGLVPRLSCRVTDSRPVPSPSVGCSSLLCRNILARLSEGETTPIPLGLGRLGSISSTTLGTAVRFRFASSFPSINFSADR